MTKEESPSTKPGGHRLRRTRNILLSLLVFYAAASVFKLCLAQWAYWGPDIVTSTEHCVLIGQLFQVSVIIGKYCHHYIVHVIFGNSKSDYFGIFVILFYLSSAHAIKI